MSRRVLSPQIPEPTKEDIERIRAVLNRIGGEHVAWGSEDTLNIWVIEQRARLDQQMSERLRTAS